VLSCIIAFFAINFAIVKYANRYLEGEVETIKNNHIAHLYQDVEILRRDVEDLKDGQKSLDLKIEKTNEKIERMNEKTNDRFNKIDSDNSYIKGMLEILVKDKK
jgi:peptidoglycan hydrolase CwlO-like protein